MLAGSRLRFEGRGDGLMVPQAELGSLTVTAALRGRAPAPRPVAGEAAAGEIAGSVTAGPFDEDFTADLDLDATGVDLAAAARTASPAGWTAISRARCTGPRRATC